MAERIVVDPITRIEGHLRAEVEISDGTIQEAFVSSTMVRGLENIVKGRNPKDVWAFVQRTCGVCTAVHATASVRAVEDAFEISCLGHYTYTITLFTFTIFMLLIG
jgi:hydrogenase large subunit